MVSVRRAAANERSRIDRGGRGAAPTVGDFQAALIARRAPERTIARVFTLGAAIRAGIRGSVTFPAGIFWILCAGGCILGRLIAASADAGGTIGTIVIAHKETIAARTERFTTPCFPRPTSGHPKQRKDRLSLVKLRITRKSLSI